MAFCVPNGSHPITVSPCYGVPEEEFKKKEGYYKELLKPFNERIKDGGEVTLKEVYDAIGYPYDEEDKDEVERLELWGWDKNGYGQLYKIKRTVTVEKIRINKYY